MFEYSVIAIGVGLLCVGIVVLGIKDGWLKAVKAPTSFLSIRRSAHKKRWKTDGPAAGEAQYAAVVFFKLNSAEVSADGYWREQAKERDLHKELNALPQLRVGRISHDFLELIINAASPEDAEKTLETVESLITSRLQDAGARDCLDLAIGFCDVPDPALLGRVFEDAKHAAEEARIKRKAIVRYDGAALQAQRAEKHALMKDLEEAIACGEVKVFYMPKQEVRTGDIQCVEALARWDHKRLGSISPDKFVKLAEETGLIGDLTLAIVHRALADQRRFEASGNKVRVDVNLSAALLNDDTFCTKLLDALSDASGGIGLEITETAIIVEHDRAIEMLHRFSNHGIWLSIDDYGSGLSSLSYLRQIPADELKIDRMFIRNLTSTNRDPVLVRSTIDLGHSLGMRVTAEGVEDQMTYALLQVMKCDEIQGYFISPALDTDSLEIFLKNRLSHVQRPVKMTIKKRA